jgi:heterodisulfide reductase subunit B
VNDELSARLGERKLESAREGGAGVLCVVCPYCWLQLDRARQARAARGEDAIPIVLVHQLLGLSLGIEPRALGLRGEGPLVPAAPAIGGARHG